MTKPSRWRFEWADLPPLRIAQQPWLDLQIGQRGVLKGCADLDGRHDGELRRSQVGHPAHVTVIESIAHRDFLQQLRLSDSPMASQRCPLVSAS